MARIYEKSNTKKSDNGLAAYDLSSGLSAKVLLDLKLNTIFDGEKNNKEIMDLITSTIHGIPSLFEDVELQHLQIYLGKSSIDQVHNRAKLHWDEKDAPYFIPIIKLKTKQISYIEKLGLKYLSYLDKKGRLCFGKLLNESIGSQGRKSNSNYHIIYIAFRIDQKHVAFPLSKSEIVLATGYLHETLREEFPKESSPVLVYEILESIVKTDSGLKLFWDIDSKED